MSFSDDKQDDDPLAVKQLAPRLQAFVHEYLIDEDATAAGLRAGFTNDALEGDTPTDLMRRDDVQRAIAVSKAQRQSRVRMTQDTVLHEMSLLARSSLEHYVVDDNGHVELTALAPEGAMRALQSIKRKVTTRTDRNGDVVRDVTVELRLWDKPTPLRIMGKQIGLFPDKVEHSGPNGGPIETVSRIERVVIDPQHDP